MPRDMREVQPQTAAQVIPADDITRAINDHLKIQLLIRSFQVTKLSQLLIIIMIKLDSRP